MGVLGQKNLLDKAEARHLIFLPVEDVVGVRPLVPDHGAEASQRRVPELGEGGKLLQPGVDQVQILKWGPLLVVILQEIELL